MRAAAVLHVPRSPYSSVVIGYERLAASLRERGHELEILAPADLGVPPVTARFLPIVFPLAVRRWLRTRPDLDVVIFHSYAGWLTGGITPPRRKVVAFHGFEPLYHEAHDAEARRSGRPLSRRYRALYGGLMPHMLKVACRSADRVLCLNSDERRAIIDRGYAPADKVWQGSHGTPEAFYGPHVYHPRATMLLAVMQWLPTKGIDYLVAAFTELARRHPDLRLTVAGTLKSADVVCAAFPEDIRARVTVIPTFADESLSAVMKACDIFVHPSVYEAFGRAVTEAMSSALPIVVTRTGVAIDYLRDGIDARIVPVGDARALVSAIEPMLDDMALRTRLGESAQARAGSLSEKASIDALATLLESLAAPD